MSATFTIAGAWSGLAGKKVRLAADMNTYEGTVTDWTVDPGGNVWLALSDLGDPDFEALVNLAHVRTLRVIP